MFVIFDVEWIEASTGARNITQFAATRVDSNWASIDSFSTLIKPERPVDWTHIALSGFMRDEFINAPKDSIGIEPFLSWLKPDDVLCCWQYEALDTMRMACMRLGFINPIRNAFCLNKRLYSIAQSKGASMFCLSDLAAWAGAEIIQPEHCSVNDVVTLQNVLVKMGISQNDILPQFLSTSKKELAQKKRNAKILSSEQYHYIYTPDSEVFHCKECSVIRNAKKILGCTYYRTAAEKRRPCKLCKPVRDPMLEPDVPQKTPSRPTTSILDEIVSARLLGNQNVEIARKNLVGCCHNSIHPGKLTARIIEQHDCIGKQCHFFEKYADSPYWQKLEDARIQKQNRKAKKAQMKKIQAAEADDISDLIDQFQSYADDAGYGMEIIDLKKESGIFKVFYVSEFPFADGNRFPEFLNAAYYYFPKKKIVLRHIKGLDGRFVTINEYYARAR